MKGTTIASNSTKNLVKNRLISAKKGHSLLKKKSDALKFHLLEITKKIKDQEISLNHLYTEGIFLKNQAQLNFPDLDTRLLFGVSDEGMIEINRSINSVMGIELETLYLNFAMDKGGWASSKMKVKKSRVAFQEFLEGVFTLATLKSNFEKMNEETKNLNKKLNAIEFVIIPRLENTIKYIMDELEEQEREEIFRMKKVIENKKKR